MHAADEEVSGNVNQELLRIDDDNGEYDNISVVQYGPVILRGLSRLCRKNILTAPKQLLSMDGKCLNCR